MQAALATGGSFAVAPGAGRSSVPRVDTSASFPLADEASLPTPCLVFVRPQLERNLSAMLAMVHGDTARLRPHVKTHKCAQIVRRQVELGVSKVKCATIAECELSAGAGATDVLLGHPAIGPTSRRLAELAAKFPDVQFSGVVDCPESLASLASAAAAAEVVLGAWLDVDCGMGRTGLAPGPLAVDLYRQLCQTPSLRPRGLHAYDGHVTARDPAERRRACNEAFAPVTELRAELAARGLPVPALVASGSPTFPFHAEATDGRECSPGTTVLWDAGYAEKHADLPFEPAAFVLTRVISKPCAGRLTLDLGHKAIASENPHPRVHLLELPDARAVIHSEEHLVVETEVASAVPVGAVLHGIPRHVCPTVALYQEALVSDGHAVVEAWPIVARDRRLTV